MFKFMARRLRSGEEGFTLIELLVVVAIIALLTTFALPKIYNAVSKAKQAPGQSDMSTISGALDRFYYEKEVYPAVTGGMIDEPAFKVATTQYLRKSTPMKNGYDVGYIYISDAGGNFFVLVDPQKSTSVVVTCNGRTETFTGLTQAMTVKASVKAVSPSVVGFDKDDIALGCTTNNGVVVTN